DGDVDLRSRRGPNRQVLEFVRKNGDTESLEEALSAALQAADAEFGGILREVDQIFQLLKSPDPDKQALRVAEHLAVWCAMKQAILDRELRRLALTDDLTCVFNRRGFFAAATQQLKRAIRKSERLLLFFCDVDGLKQVNDTFGHEEGDLALIRVADALEKSFRSSDIVARLGGDEFVVLALETSERCEEMIQRRVLRGVKNGRPLASGGALLPFKSGGRFFPPPPGPLGGFLCPGRQAP